MRRLVLFAFVIAACGQTVAAPPSTPSEAPLIVQDGPWPDPALGAATRGRPQTPPPLPNGFAPHTPPQAPTPDVALKTSAFEVGALPAPRRVSTAQAQTWIAGTGQGLMDFMDRARGSGKWMKSGPISDGEWNTRVFAGPFQDLVRATAVARPADGRFFHLDTMTVDAAYAVPWEENTQYVDATMTFRDHAEYPPAEGELFYTWHVRLATVPRGPSGFADGYDGVTLTTWTRTTPYWTRAGLEIEATSAIAGYLWNESYVPGGTQQFANMRDVTPFWRSRIEALNELNALFAAGKLTERRFEDAWVRIDGFDPLTRFGGGVVHATIGGTLIEVVSGHTYRVPFTEPMKFFRYGSDGVNMSGWTAIDAFQDGEWVSGGVLALDKLNTTFG